MIQVAEKPEEKELNVRQQMFVRRYLETYNAAQAALDVGYSAVNAVLLLRYPHIKKAIRDAMAADGMSPNEIIARLSRIARADITDILDVDDSGYARVNFKRAKEAGKLGLVSEVGYDSNGMAKIKMISQLEALEKLAKINAMFTEKVQVDINNKVDVQINAQVMTQALADPALLAKLGELAEAVASKGTGGAIGALPGSVEVQATVLPADNSV